MNSKMLVHRDTLLYTNAVLSPMLVMCNNPYVFPMLHLRAGR